MRPLALVIVFAGCTPVGSSIGTSRQQIIGGTVDTGDPSVVMLQLDTGSGSATCTATLVAPQLLLTAAHCLTPDDGSGAGSGKAAGATPTAAQLAPASAFGVYMGQRHDPKTDPGAVLLPVSQVMVDPAYVSPSPDGHDLGLVFLSAPLDVPVLPMRRTALPASDQGRTARVVGYGRKIR